MPLLKIILKPLDEHNNQNNNRHSNNLHSSDTKHPKPLSNYPSSINYLLSSNTFSLKTSPSEPNLKETGRASITSKNSNFFTNFLNAKPTSTFKDDPSLKVLDIKLYIAKQLNLRPDILTLYTNDKEHKLIHLNDNEPYNFDSYPNIPFPSKDNKYRRESTGTFFSAIQNEHTHAIYYKLISERHKVIVNVFHNNIEKIIFYLSPCCSIYMLKYYIIQKLLCMNNEENININDIVIYANGFEEKEYDIYNLGNTSTLCKDYCIINEIINYYIDKALQVNNSHTVNEITNCKKTLNLLLVIKNQSKPTLGIDFKFNTFKQFTKIAFDDNAPPFREACDGLNCIMYCANTNCTLYNDYFFYHKGYGLFNIIEDVSNIECPKCKMNNNLLRSIGLINSKWSYKGLLKQKQQAKCEGEGTTFENNKLFVIPQIDFEKQYLSLLIQVKAFKNKDNVTHEKKIANKDVHNDIDSGFSESELDAINLIDSNDTNNNANKSKTMQSHYSNQHVAIISHKNTGLSSQHSEHNKKGISCEIVILNLNEFKHKNGNIIESQSTYNGNNEITYKKDTIKIEGTTFAFCNGCKNNSTVQLKTCIVF